MSEDAGDPGEDDTPPLTRWQRLKYTIVQPDDDADKKAVADDRSVEELEEAIRSSDDKERAIGLVAAPLAAIIGILVGSATIQNAKNTHQSTSEFVTLTYVLLGLAELVLATSMMHQALTRAKPARPAPPRRGGPRPANGPRPRPNKRYTPPT